MVGTSLLTHQFILLLDALHLGAGQTVEDHGQQRLGWKPWDALADLSPLLIFNCSLSPDFNVFPLLIILHPSFCTFFFFFLQKVICYSHFHFWNFLHIMPRTTFLITCYSFFFSSLRSSISLVKPFPSQLNISLPKFLFPPQPLIICQF